MNVSRIAFRVALLGLVLLVLGAPASAQQPSAAPEAPAPAVPVSAGLTRAVAGEVEKIASAIENAEKSLQRIREAGDDLGRLRDDADTIITETTRLADTLRPRLAAARRQYESLGPAPAKDAPAEPPAVAAERERLKTVVSEMDGAIKTLELTWARARDLIEKITDLRYTLFTRNLLERRQSPLLPGVWRTASEDIPSIWRFITYATNDWLRSAGRVGWELVLLVIAAGLLFFGARTGVRMLETRYVLGCGDAQPTFFQRAQRIAWLAPARTLPALLAVGALYWGLSALRLLYFPSEMIVAAIFKGTAVLIIVGAIIRAVLAPNDPDLRLVDVSCRTAASLGNYLLAIAGVYALDMVLADIGRALVVPLSITVVQTFIASIAYCALLIGFVLTPFEPRNGGSAARLPRHAPWWLKLPLWIMAAFILVTTLTGFVALGRFAAQQMVITGAIVAAAGLVYLAIRAITRAPVDSVHPVGRMLETQFGIDAPRRQQLASLAEVALLLLLLTVTVPFILIQWGYSATDIRDWLTRAFFGFEIGQFRISLARILLGLLLFMALLFVTRMAQRWLRERVLQPPRVDAGIANSIETSIGYAGIALSAVLAVSYAGLDVTNLAIVAGALSVGIGFGLQSIVNNFVSGLILLVERPIKVGDWIVVGDQQGNVRRISVRATEVETFDRASLIIPNSELITGRVLNWTHRNTLGRVVIRVGTSYDSDPERVIGILLESARANPEVLAEPAPGASFDAFGASSLDFSLRVQIADVTRSLAVQTQLRVAILKAFRAAGIEIPFNQHDVHLRDLDGVKSMLARVIEQRAAAQTQPPVDGGQKSGGKNDQPLT